MLKRFTPKFGRLGERTDKDSKSKKKGNKASPGFSSPSNDFLVKITHAGGQQEQYKHAVPASKLMSKYPGMWVARPEVFKVPHQSVLRREDLLLPGHKYILISYRDVQKLKRKHPDPGKNKEPNGVVAEEMLDSSKTSSPSGHKSKENVKMRVPNGVAHQVTLDVEINRSPNGHHHKENGKMKGPNGVAGQEMLETRTALSPSENTKMDGSLGGEVLEDSFVSAKDFYIPKEKPTGSSRRKGIRAKKPFVPPLPRARQYRSYGWQPSLPTVKELSP